MLQCDDQVYSWDAENRLVAIEPSVVSNGVRKVQMDYDPLGRMVRLMESNYTNAWTTVSTRRFVYDGWNLLAEIETDLQTGQTNRTFYVWGPDISGTPQGAGGVGGLVAVVKDQQVFVPCYDGNGNITEYVDSDGAVVARYRYDPFGIILEASGSRAEEFRFRFSTKYHEPVSGLVLYQKRAYCPELGRWLSRDPIGEDGGLNLYSFCGNNPVDRFDKLGEAYFAVRPLEGFQVVPKLPTGGRLDTNNIEVAHEHLFFEDGGTPSNLGFFLDGRVKPERGSFVYRKTLTGYNDCVMRVAVDATPPMPYSLLGINRNWDKKFNCQDWAESVRKTYERFINSPGIRKRCCVK